jgi:hypothetical protein
MEFSLYRFVVAEGGDLGQVALCHARCRQGQRPRLQPFELKWKIWFQRFACEGKPLKTAYSLHCRNSRLKPGVNETSGQKMYLSRQWSPRSSGH